MPTHTTAAAINCFHQVKQILLRSISSWSYCDIRHTTDCVTVHMHCLALGIHITHHIFEECSRLPREILPNQIAMMHKRQYARLYMPVCLKIVGSEYVVFFCLTSIIQARRSVLYSFRSRPKNISSGIFWSNYYRHHYTTSTLTAAPGLLYYVLRAEYLLWYLAATAVVDDLPMSMDVLCGVHPPGRTKLLQVLFRVSATRTGRSNLNR